MASSSGASSSSSPPLEWKFSQVFGERLPGEDLVEVDVISAIEFEKNGDFLAVGDSGGRVIIFERKDGKDDLSYNELEPSDFVFVRQPEYQYKTEFQSHEPEFDYLKSLEFEEKIKQVRWCATVSGSQFLLSTNDKTIKLWKVKEYKVKKVKEMNPNSVISSENALLAERSFMNGQDKPYIANGYRLEWKETIGEKMLAFPQIHSKVAHVEDTIRSSCRRVYSHAHDFNINSISNNSDGETFISADDLRINLWNFETSGQCFNIIDMKPSNMEDLTEIITSAEFHPSHCNLLAFSSSRGFIRLVDMRQSALCDNGARLLQDAEYHGSKSFFTEIITSISHLKFTNDGRHILSRDYMSLKVLDLELVI